MADDHSPDNLTSDLKDLLSQIKGSATDTRNAFRMAAEYVSGAHLFSLARPAVTVFGSARLGKDHPHYGEAVKVGELIAKAGFNLITGAGPGIMEAASKGAMEAGAKTFGANIVVPHEQRPNPYITDVMGFNGFEVRKLMLLRYSVAFVALPGGFGTLDEVTEALNLFQSGKLKRLPVLLYGRPFWEGFIRWAEEQLVGGGTVTQSELDQLSIVDDASGLEKALAELASQAREKRD